MKSFSLSLRNLSRRPGRTAALTLLTRRRRGEDPVGGNEPTPVTAPGAQAPIENAGQSSDGDQGSGQLPTRFAYPRRSEAETAPQRTGDGRAGKRSAREIGRRAREMILSQVILTRIRGWPRARGEPKGIPRASPG